VREVTEQDYRLGDDNPYGIDCGNGALLPLAALTVGRRLLLTAIAVSRADGTE
jgi:hypothetical protein